MNALIPTTEMKLNEALQPMVNARDLHQFLQVGRDFSTWIKERISEYEFKVKEDYLLPKSGEQVPHQGGVRFVEKIDYLLTLNMAKELAMVERSEKGRMARRYFIDCERQLMHDDNWLERRVLERFAGFRLVEFNRQSLAHFVNQVVSRLTEDQVIQAKEKVMRMMKTQQAEHKREQLRICLTFKMSAAKRQAYEAKLSQLEQGLLS